MMSLLFISMQVSLLSLILSHPLALGMLLLIQSISFSIIMGMILTNLWYSYIFFLMMISGMLILFMYMTSISSNKKFNLSKYLIMLTIMMTIIMTYFFLKTHFLLSINYGFNLMNSVYMMYNFPLMMMMIILIIYLLLTLIATVKIINIKIGPLRQKF